MCVRAIDACVCVENKHNTPAQHSCPPWTRRARGETGLGTAIRGVERVTPNPLSLSTLVLGAQSDPAVTQNVATIERIMISGRQETRLCEHGVNRLPWLHSLHPFGTVAFNGKEGGWWSACVCVRERERGRVSECERNHESVCVRETDRVGVCGYTYVYMKGMFGSSVGY